MAVESSLRRTQTRQIAYAVVLSALAIALSPLSIPLGIAKIFPGQHFINVIAAVLLGLWWGLAIAFVTSLARNLLGIGTPLAFPGSMIGVVLAGLAFRATGRVWLAGLGELIRYAPGGAPRSEPADRLARPATGYLLFQPPGRPRAELGHAVPGR